MNAITFAARLTFLFALFLLYGTRDGLSMWEKQRVACRLFARTSGMHSINFLSASCASLRNVFPSWEGISYEKISAGLRA